MISNFYTPMLAPNELAAMYKIHHLGNYYLSIFSRMCAVFAGIYVLRTSIQSMITDNENK